MKSCQSCSKPLKKDADHGTEAGGGRSEKFCSLCYANGKFLQPDITVTQMQDLVRDKMVEMGFPKFLTGFFTRGIPKLERWSTAAHS